MLKSFRQIKRNVNRATRYSRKMKRTTKKLDKFTTIIEKKIERETVIRTMPLENMDGFYFEDYLAKLFKDLGYQVERTKSSGDFGADLIIFDQGWKVIIQAKRYSSKVGIRAVQEISSAQRYYQADYMAVVTNNFFTKAAKELATTNDVILINGQLLMDLVSKRDMVNETKPKKKRGLFARIFNK